MQDINAKMNTYLSEHNPNSSLSLSVEYIQMPYNVSNIFKQFLDKQVNNFKNTILVKESDTVDEKTDKMIDMLIQLIITYSYVESTPYNLINDLVDVISLQ